jgi:hypothetical protein
LAQSLYARMAYIERIRSFKPSKADEQNIVVKRQLRTPSFAATQSPSAPTRSDDRHGTILLADPHAPV